MNRYQERQLETKVVEITAVDVANSKITATDSYGAFLDIKIHFSEPLIVIPAVRETWQIKREGIDWVLHKRFVKELEENSKLLVPGDYQLKTESTIWLEGASINIRGSIEIELEADQSVVVRDSNKIPIFKIDEDGSVHIKTGSAILADL